MKTAAAFRAGLATDPGLERAINEDRVLSDEARGIFLVIDGLGGHAAGEMAAETALQILKEETAALDGESDIEAQIRRAITKANNRIYELAASHSDWHGMACVLTLAVAQDDRVVVGHVGDSRLYLVWNGRLKKITCDHSPVGEQEDLGELTEAEAMRHPRRNEVFRDVGSRLRDPDDPDFIETRTFLFRPDAALLLCSDGLSDVLRSAQINAIVERYDGDPVRTARQLVEAANAAGGKDNISVVFVAGPEFPGTRANALEEARPRHAITRMRSGAGRTQSVFRRILWLLAGMVLGFLFWAALERLIPRPAAPPPAPEQARVPSHIAVNASNPRGITEALGAAQPGDTIIVPPGEYLGPIEIRNGIDLVSTAPRQAVIKSDPAAASNPGVALIARGVKSARLTGFRIAGDEAHPLRAAIAIADSSVELDDTEVSGASEAGVRIEGASSPTLLANSIHDNAGAGIVIGDQSTPRLAGNWVSENGMGENPRPGIEIAPEARPVLERNVISRNGLAGFGNPAAALAAEIRKQNVIDATAAHGRSRAKASGAAVPEKQSMR